MNPFKQTKVAVPPRSVLPSYILIESRIPATHGEKLLGRIVIDYGNPTDEYRPEDPRPALSSGPKFLEIIDTEFSSLFSIEKNKVAQLKVGLILDLDLHKLEKEDSSLKSCFVRTRSLPQHRDAFNALKRHHGPEIAQLLNDNERRGYMVVGYKSCVNGQMGRSREYANGMKLDIKVPTGAAVTAGTHGAVNLGTQADISAGLGTEGKGTLSTSSTMAGEQIFAVRYRLISLTKKEEVDFGAVPRVDNEHGVFGDSDDEGDNEDFITEDDASDNDNGGPEAQEGESLVLCGEFKGSDSPLVIQSDIMDGCKAVVNTAERMDAKPDLDLKEAKEGKGG